MGKLRQPRKKTAIILSSDDDEEVAVPKTRKLSSQRSLPSSEKENGSQFTRADKPNRRNNAKPAASASPSSQTSTKTTPTTSKSKPSKPQSKTIYSFFNTATQKQRSQTPASPAKKLSTPVEVEEDLIQDDDSLGEDMASLGETKFGSRYPIPVRQKRKRDGLDDGPLDGSALPRGSQVFKKPNLNTGGSTAITEAPTQDSRPWSDRFGPSTLDELAVHKKKVQDVRTWLESVMSGRDRQRLLILKGSAGTGKTMTINLLAKDMGLRINEWKNLGTSGGSEEGFVSMSAHFEDFIARTGTFGVLDMGGSDSQRRSQVPKEEGDQKRVIMIEEFPNTFSRSSSGLNSFRSAVMQYLEATTPSMDALFSGKKSAPKKITPIVMVISETLLSTSTASADSFTAYRLLGPEILSHPGATVLEFNPVAPTFMTKALDLIVQKEARQSGRKTAPGPSVIKHLAEIGDIRSAISSLQFLCLRGDNQDNWSGKVKTTKTKRGSEAPLSKMETASLESITQRESTLGIFHAVGKVVYNKRDSPLATDTPPPQPPSHLPQFARSKISEVDIEALLAELGTDIQTFVAAVHENYALSCEGIDLEDTLDHVNGCIDALSDADILSPDRFGSSHNRTTLQGTSTDSLRQEELSFQTTVRGLLFNLPHPVKRTAPPPTLRSKGKGLGRGAANQMYYPVSMRLWRKRDELDQLLELFIIKMRDGALKVGPRKSGGFQSGKPTGVEAWRVNRYGGVPTPPANSTSISASDEDLDSPMSLLAGGSSVKSEMLLERLPYMAMIERKNISFGSSNLFKELERITKVTGSGGLNGHEEEELEVEAEADTTEQWSTDKPVEGEKKTTKFGIAKGGDQAGIVKAKMQSLVLVDDDIEDD
ncbi:Rad17-domain-containing protein [Venturia nashicola]|uniref:Rad17-domain-containing protein n=1 Tax=Venturia nashicola TaxID=86259 RepID=A0A4Z1NMZ8_9PEZI|nr:Rad17-domain-containing protein [Venturia nashicola]